MAGKSCPRDDKERRLRRRGGVMASISPSPLSRPPCASCAAPSTLGRGSEHVGVDLSPAELPRRPKADAV